jgi:outer membrane protein assembly factor BamB
MSKPTLLASLILLLASPSLFNDDGPDELWAAARKGDATRIEALLSSGIDVNAKTHYGATALWFAAYKGQLDAVTVLVRHKAQVDVMDSVWGVSPLGWALEKDDADMIEVLLAAGARGADGAAVSAATDGHLKALRKLLDKGKISSEAINAAWMLARAKPAAIKQILVDAGAKAFTRADLYAAGMDLSPFTGTFESANGVKLTITLSNDVLKANSSYTGAMILKALPDDSFKPAGMDRFKLRFEFKDGKPSKLFLSRGSNETPFERQPTQQRIQISADKIEDKPVVVDQPRNWPGFRGPHASGLADGQHPPTAWDAETGQNIRWKTPIPGLAHSSPIVWNNSVIVTTAISGQAESEFKPGLYGAGTSAADVSNHRFEVYCLDKRTGQILWQQNAGKGVPKVKRHIKATHANPTPATDGKHIVVSFASEGLFCYDFTGSLLWKQDLGVLDAGAFNDPDVQWGAASSPIIFKNLVIVQCDRQSDSYIAAFDISSGKQVWRTPRDEPPSWGTPTVVEGPKGFELVANGTKFIRGYDPTTGTELWRLGGNSEITVPTPFAAQGLIFVTSGYHPIQPIYAIWPGAKGDISPKKGDAGQFLAWSTERGGPYMPTPIAYGEHLYVCSNSGIVTCFESKTGTQVYRQRLGSTDGHSASPVAADGRIYFTSEDGDIYVVKAGPTFELLAINKMADPCLATPAISDGIMFVRSQHYMFGIGPK